MRNTEINIVSLAFDIDARFNIVSNGIAVSYTHLALNEARFQENI